METTDAFFKRIYSADAGYRVIERLENRDRQRWRKNQLRRPSIPVSK